MKDYFYFSNIGDITSKLTLIYLGYGFSNFLAGILSKKVSLKYILFFGMLLMSASSMLVYFVNPESFGLMIFLVFLMGLGGGTYHPAANTIATTLFEKRQGFAIGVLSIGSAVGFIIAPFIGDYFGLKLHDFKNLFLCSGLISFIFTILFLIFADNIKVNSTYTSVPIKNKSISKKILIFAIILLCIPCTIKELLSWSFYEITPFWVNAGFSGGIAISIIQMMQFLPGLLIQPITGKLCDIFKPVKMMIISVILFALGFAMFCINNHIILWIALFIFGTGISASTVASEVYLASLVKPEKRALIYGIVLSVALGVGGFLSGFSGKVVDIYGKNSVIGYNIWFLFISIISILGLFTYFIIEKIRNKAFEF